MFKFSSFSNTGSAPMAGGGKNSSHKAIVVLEINVHMHCKACERSVSRTLGKLKGIEKVSTDMNNNKAIVFGQIEPKKVLKKLRKKTGKRAKIVAKEETSKEDIEYEQATNTRSDQMLTPRFLVFEDSSFDQFVLDLEMFSDENPLSCTIM